MSKLANDDPATDLHAVPAAGPAPLVRPASVALVGFGTVGQAVARILCESPHPELRLHAVCNRQIEKKKVDWVPDEVKWSDRLDDALAPDVDIVVELMGGLEPAGWLIRRALESGRSVVTANKQLVAYHGGELAEIAARCGQHLRFEAAVGAGIPLVRAIEDGLAGDRLFTIAGILNGTCNFILTRMEESGTPFDVALAEAQQLGIAEADPAEDIDGSDARAKLAILASVAFGCHPRPQEIDCRSIARVENTDFRYASRLHSTIRQVAWARRDRESGRLAAAVRPMLVSSRSALARVEGSDNLLTVEGEFGGLTGFLGKGAGGAATAVAVVSDLLSIVRGVPARHSIRASQIPADCSVSGDFTAPQYIRFNVDDRPGIIAAIATAFSKYDISIDAILQEPGYQRTRLPFVVTLDSCRTSVVEAALQDVEALDFNVQRPLHLPILVSNVR
jgi:homoserine dehydrogenase